MMFENKSALVTGGSNGIGQATAIALAKAGANVLISDVDADNGAETVRLIEADGGTASYITADVSNEDEVKTMMDAIVDRYGTLDIAVNNAGIGGGMGRIHEQETDAFERVMTVNVKGTWLCMKYEIPMMQQNELGGVIINLASVAGLVGFPGNAPYSASKHAVIGLTKSAALEFASKRIRVNAVCPSFTDTAMVGNLVDEAPQLADNVRVASPMRRMGTAEEIANTIVWLASDQASFINGVALAADGGLTAM